MSVEASGSNPLEVVLTHELASGTFARIYCAEARAPGGVDRIVSVKVLRAQWNESHELVTRTRDEARLLARLRHRSIVRVEHLGELDGRLAIVMEFVDGVDLHQLVDSLRAEGSRIPPRAALKIAAEVAAALDAAHFGVPYGVEKPLQVVHRDIKPQNIMVSVDGEVKVLDFGTARSVQEHRAAQTHQLRFGSLKYMSPERREGDRGDLAGDVYALGLVLLELLANEWLPMLPLDAEEHDEAVQAWIVANAARGMPNAAWSEALRELLSRMLAADATRRPLPADCVRLLRAFAEQAEPPDLDRFAAERVVPLTRRLRPGDREGPLSGRHVVFDGSGPRLPSSRTMEVPVETAPLPRPAPTPLRPPPWPAGAGTFAVPEAAPIVPPPRRPPLRVISTPKELRGSAVAARVEPIPEVEPATPPRGPWSAGLVIAAVGAVLLAAMVIFGLVASLAYWYFDRAPADVPALVPPAASAPRPTSPPAEDPGLLPSTATPSPPDPVRTHLTVHLESSPTQWVRVENAVGELVASGEAALDAEVPPGPYTLVVKAVGRLPVRGPIVSSGAEIRLSCTENPDGSVGCAGAPSAVTLLPPSTP